MISWGNENCSEAPPSSHAPAAWENHSVSGSSELCLTRLCRQVKVYCCPGCHGSSLAQHKASHLEAEPQGSSQRGFRQSYCALNPATVFLFVSQWHRFLQCGWGLPSGSSIISLCGSSWVGRVLTIQKQQQCGKVNKPVGGTLPAPGHRRTTCKLWLFSQQIYLEGQDASKVNSSSVADILLLFPQKELASWLIQKQRVGGGAGGGSCRMFPLPSEIKERPSETWAHFFKHSRPSLLLLKWFEDKCSIWMDGVHQNTIL